MLGDLSVSANGLKQCRRRKNKEINMKRQKGAVWIRNLPPSPPQVLLFYTLATALCKPARSVIAPLSRFLHCWTKTHPFWQSAPLARRSANKSQECIHLVDQPRRSVEPFSAIHITTGLLDTFFFFCLFLALSLNPLVYSDDLFFVSYIPAGLTFWKDKA